MFVVVVGMLDRVSGRRRMRETAEKEEEEEDEYESLFVFSHRPLKENERESLVAASRETGE